MYKSFDEAKFNQAIINKDYEYIKTCIISAIRNNPRFIKEPGEDFSEATKVFNKIISDCPEMLEDYVPQAGELEYNKDNSDSWDKEYFIRQTIFLGRNFCQKRYDRLKVIGQKVYPSENFPEPQGQEADVTQIPSQKVLQTKKPLPKKKLILGAGILLLVVLVAIVVAKFLL